MGQGVLSSNSYATLTQHELTADYPSPDGPRERRAHRHRLREAHGKLPVMSGTERRFIGPTDQVACASAAPIALAPIGAGLLLLVAPPSSLNIPLRTRQQMTRLECGGTWAEVHATVERICHTEAVTH